jgi:hypothetical protein
MPVDRRPKTLLCGRSQAVVSGETFVAAAILVGVAARAIPVAPRLVAIWIAISRLGMVLHDLGPNLVQHLPPNFLILFDLLALTASAIGHRHDGLLGNVPDE